MTSLEELITFNDEVARLTRAGIPMDLGLLQLSHDPDIANNQINAAVTRRMQSGVALEDVMAEEDPVFPAIYQSVVSAGLRCGRLPAALEGLNQYTQSLLGLRQSLYSALIYPFIVCMLAYVFFVGSCLFYVPTYYHLSTDLGVVASSALILARILHDTLPFWVAIPPVLLIALLFVWFRPKSSRTLSLRGLPGLFNWWPGVSRITTDQRCASLAELLALLVEHDVPLHEGLSLAARAVGDRKLTSAARQMAAAAEQGRPLTQDSHGANQFPPLLRWALTSSTGTGGLASTLRLAAKTYRNRAERRAARLRVVMPALTCVVFAGGVTLLYCLSVFVPIVRLIQDLS